MTTSSKEKDSRDPLDIDKDLSWRILCVIMEYQRLYRNCALIFTCTHRPISVQQKYFLIGRVEGDKRKPITWVDGVAKKSKHNYFPCLAVDVAILVGGKLTWKPLYYKRLGPLCKKYGLKWGGNFKTVKDYPHIYK